MRIAVCISGFVRIWKDTKKSFLEQIYQDPTVEIDLFIHTYHQNYYEFTSGKEDVLLTTNDFYELFEGLNVASLVIEDRRITLPKVTQDANKYSFTENFNLPQKESSSETSNSIPIGVRTYDHLRKIHLCNEERKKYEKEHGFKYDLVMKTRFDLVYFNKINWNLCLDNHLHFDYGACFGWPNDCVCVCVPELMDLYAGRFTLFDEMFFSEATVRGICAHATLRYVISKYAISIGTPVVNTLCFRSERSVQYGGNYRFFCDLRWLYHKISSMKLTNVFEIEEIKGKLLTQK